MAKSWWIGADEIYNRIFIEDNSLRLDHVFHVKKTEIIEKLELAKYIENYTTKCHRDIRDNLPIRIIVASDRINKVINSLPLCTTHIEIGVIGVIELIKRSCTPDFLKFNSIFFPLSVPKQKLYFPENISFVSIMFSSTRVMDQVVRIIEEAPSSLHHVGICIEFQSARIFNIGEIDAIKTFWRKRPGPSGTNEHGTLVFLYAHKWSSHAEKFINIYTHIDDAVDLMSKTVI